jgi:hypothetical protein
MGCEPDKHRWEFVESSDGGDHYQCMNANCGEVLFEAMDGIGG